MRLVPLPLLPPLPMLPEGRTPEPAGAVVTIDAGLTVDAVLVARTVWRVMGMPDKEPPGLDSKVVLVAGVGNGSGGMVKSLEIMLSTSSPTLWM